MVPKPQRKYVVTSKWLFKIKHGVDGSILKYTVRIVAIGFSHKDGIDCNEDFALVARYTTIQSIVALVAS